MKKRLKIFFTDFWRGFEPLDFFIYKILEKYFDVEITSDDPDVLFFSTYSFEYKKFNCKRVQFIAENVRPNFSVADYVLSFDFGDSDAHLRLPLYAIDYDIKWPLEDLILRKTDTELKNLLNEKSEFCAFIVSNPGCNERNLFFDLLSKYKRVDSFGAYKNNMSHENNLIGIHNFEVKREIIKKYKFVIAFENTSYNGYVTEKILHPIQVNSIPIYWGSPSIAKEFNEKRFVNTHAFDSFELAIEYIRLLDNDDELYMKMLSEPFFLGNVLNEFCAKERLESFIINAVSSNIKPVGKKIINRIKSLPILNGLNPYIQKISKQ
ncbi:MAG: hypothetical protein K2Y12_01890 [Chitinophagaceae bacterium]|nr:hypothetical protein [Chitinophagaceae bacterium]